MKVNKVGRIEISQDERGELIVNVYGCEIDNQGAPEMTTGEAIEFILLHVVSEIKKDDDYSKPIDKSLNTVTYIQGDENENRTQQRK